MCYVLQTGSFNIATGILDDVWSIYVAHLIYRRRKINWVNYKTGEKDIYFRMNADGRKASIAIELTHKNAEIQVLYFEQLEQLKPLLRETLTEEWNWQLHANNEQGKTISRVFTEIENVSIFKKEDWAKLISFFKPRIIALDEFWSTAKYSFEAMR